MRFLFFLFATLDSSFLPIINVSYTTTNALSVLQSESLIAQEQKASAKLNSLQWTFKKQTPTKTGVWRPVHPTVMHGKVKGGGYIYGSPLYGHTVDTVKLGGAHAVSNSQVSTTMNCITALACQFFIILSLVAVVRTMHEIGRNTQPNKCLLALQVV